MEEGIEVQGLGLWDRACDARPFVAPDPWQPLKLEIFGNPFRALLDSSCVPTTHAVDEVPVVPVMRSCVSEATGV